MPYVADVDQSEWVEHTTHDTALALADGIRFSVLIPATVKWECTRQLRAQGKSGPTFYVQLFATGLFFLLKGQIERPATVTIDGEYEEGERAPL